MILSGAVSDLSQAGTVWERRNEIQLIDVREPHEFKAGAIEGATNITLGELMAGGGYVYPDRPVVLVCKQGSRSEMAALMLQARGYEAYNLTGGMEAWEEEGLPFNDSQGGAGRVA